ncbi:hypothetical protein LARI1_G000683, partial [Lachnellula arida]
MLGSEWGESLHHGMTRGRAEDGLESQEPQAIRLLVNNAGIARADNTKYSNEAPDFESAQTISEHLWKPDPIAWASTFETNVTSQFSVSAGFLPLLTSSFSSCIINIASISGVTKGSSDGQFAYSAYTQSCVPHLMGMQATTFLKAE